MNRREREILDEHKAALARVSEDARRLQQQLDAVRALAEREGARAHLIPFEGVDPDDLLRILDGGAT